MDYLCTNVGVLGRVRYIPGKSQNLNIIVSNSRNVLYFGQHAQRAPSIYQQTQRLPAVSDGLHGTEVHSCYVLLILNIYVFVRQKYSS